MDATRLPTEVELAFEVMPCNALRTAHQIGPCDYADELRPVTAVRRLAADSSAALLQQEKQALTALIEGVSSTAPPVEEAWAGTDEWHER